MFYLPVKNMIRTENVLHWSVTDARTSPRPAKNPHVIIRYLGCMRFINGLAITASGIKNKIQGVQKKTRTLIAP